MTINYYESRQAQIYETLCVETLLNQTTYNNNDLLTALKSFGDAMIGTLMREEHASHLTIRNLSNYIFDLAFAVDMTGDKNVSYTVEQLELLSKRIHSLETGAKGEKRAHRAMFGVDGPNRILKNVEIVIDDEPYESDLIVINRHGIRIVEVKTQNVDTYIDENGRLCSAKWQDKKNVSVQMANQRSAVRRVIETAFPGNERMLTIAENVKSVLLSAGNASITDTRGRETIETCDTIADYLNNTATSVELTREEINTLADVIEKASSPKKYDVNYDYERVAKAFSLAVAKIELAADMVRANSETVDQDELDVGMIDDDIDFPKSEKKNDHTALKIAGGIAAVTALGIAWKLFRRLI